MDARTAISLPMPLRRLAEAVARPTRGEAMALALGVAGMALALGVSVSEAMMAPPPLTQDTLRHAASATAPADLCPEGWAARHAASTGTTEAAVTARYLHEAMTLSDNTVIAAASLYLARPEDRAGLRPPAQLNAQIVLCIAESRRLTQPAAELIPPSLRDV